MRGGGHDPASFSKSVGVARNFADYGYNVGHNKAIFVLRGGTHAEQDISKALGYANEKEVCVGSASSMLVTKKKTKKVGG